MTKAHVQTKSVQSGNVFAAIGFMSAEAADLTAKSRLITAIGEPSSDAN
jgi:hypothetical protein